MRLFFHGSKTEEDGRVRIDEFALLRIEVVALSHNMFFAKTGAKTGMLYFQGFRDLVFPDFSPIL